MMKCPRCGTDINETMMFCTYCGLQLTREMFSGQNQGYMMGSENFNQSENPQEVPISNQQGNSSFNSGQSSNQSNSAPVDNNIVPARSNTENNHVESAASNNNGLPPKKDNAIVSAWKKLSFFSKLFTIAITISGILFIISVAMHKGFPILFSCILIFGLIVALFMHKQLFFKKPHNFYKYLIAFGSFALIVVTIWSFTWNVFSKGNGAQASEQVAKVTYIKIPASSDSYIGRMYEDVYSEIAGLGFVNVRAEGVKDLEISEKTKEKTVSSVTSNSKSFVAEEEISKDSIIVIKYHTLADITVPISSSEARTMDYEKVAELFKTAGFSNVVTTTVQDEDPDEMTEGFVTTVIMGTRALLDTDLSFPADTKVEIVNHTAYEKYPVNLHIDNNCSVGMKIMFNSKDESTVEPASKKDIEYKNKKGDLNITITLDDNSVKPIEKKIAIDGPVNIAYAFEKVDSKYHYRKLYEEHNRELIAGEIRLSIGISDCGGDYNTIVEEFRRLGFKNISASPVYDQEDSSHDNTIASVKIKDNSEFYKGEIYKESDPVTIIYHMAKTSDPNYIPPQQKTDPVTVNKNSMPVMEGTSVDIVVKKAKEYGLSQVFSDEDFGYGTKQKSLSDSSGVLNLRIIYSTKTNEILCANVTTSFLASDSQQKGFIIGMASVLCPSSDSKEVTDWVVTNVGTKKSTTIGEFVYEVSLGPKNNAVYYAGVDNCEDWISSKE